jgi:hypothetical protein
MVREVGFDQALSVHLYQKRFVAEKGSGLNA